MRYKATLVKPTPDVPDAEGIMPRPLERYSNHKGRLQEEMNVLLDGCPDGSEVVVYEMVAVEQARFRKKGAGA